MAPWSMSQGAFTLLLCCVVAMWRPGNAQNLSTPVTKVSKMLQDMKVKSAKLKKEADATWTKVETACATTIGTKMAEIKAFETDITKLDAEVLQLKSDIKDLIKLIADDQSGYQQDSATLADTRKTRLKEEHTYQRDLNEYTVALSAVQRAIKIMDSHAAASFLQTSKSRKSSDRIRAAMEEVAHSVRQLSLYTPDSGDGLAKDDKIFDEFKTLTTNSGTYKSVAGTGKGVIGVLQGLQNTFTKAKDTLVSDEKKAKSTFLSTEANLEKQIETTRASLATNKGTKAQKEELQTVKEGELNQAKINKNATQAFLDKTMAICKEKKANYEEMTKLREQEIAALDKAVQIIDGTVKSNAASLDTKAGKAFMQLTRGDPQDLRRLVSSLNDFMNDKAVKLRSHSLALFAHAVKVLDTKQAPADALAKVKKMIADLILKLQQDSASEATQKAWCDAELKKNEKEKEDSKADIKKHSAQVEKIQGDLKMLAQEEVTLNATIKESKKEKVDLETKRAAEKKENNQTITDAKESVVAIDAAITVLTEYFKNASKAESFIQRGQHGSYADQKPTKNELSKDITAADTEGPQIAEGANVIAMLEVVRDSYKTLVVKTEAAEKKAEEQYNAQMTDTLVMITTSESERDNKMKLEAENTKLLPQKESDVKASTVALADAETNYENLKAPCLNGNAAEQRKQQLEGEIAALKEALTMLESYASSSLLQEVQASAVSDDVALKGFATQPSTDQVAKVAKLLTGIKADVEKDLKADTKAYDDMIMWCAKTITETQAAIKTQVDRDAELVTAIEISAQQKNVLTVQIASLKTETAENQQSLKQMGQLRTNDQKAFRKGEKELVVAISSLRSAILVLETRYNATEKADKRDFKTEQAKLKGEKDALMPAKSKTSLTRIADDVAKALKALPTSQFNIAVTGETGAILQGFLSRPEELVLPGGHNAGLTQTASSLSEPASGKAILGILGSLLDTFTADLAAMQGKEKAGITTYSSTKAAKQKQIDAMLASTATKEGQLAHYTTMNAQAKEDLAYLRETNKFDMQYLQQVRDQCSATQTEFQLRKKTREEEIAALSEAISILTAGSGASPAPPPPAKSLIHHAKRVRKVFLKHHSPKKRGVLKIGAPNSTSGAAVAAAQPKLAPSSFLQLSSDVHDISDRDRRSQDAPLKRSLAALESQVRLAHQQSSMGPLTGGAIKSVVTQVEVVVVQLQTQKQMEIKKKETCVKEKNAATEQRQRRITDEAKLNNTETTLKSTIKGVVSDLDEIAKQVKELNASLKEAAKTRSETHAAYKASVKEQLEQQKVLHSAITALKNFYAEKAKEKTEFLQAPAAAVVAPKSLQSYFDELEQQLRNAGQEITEGHTESSGQLAKQTAQYDAWARNPKIKTVCETGFNAGHSALRFLAQSKATLYEFDLGAHSYGRIAAAFLMSQFPGRLHNLWGDSTVVLPLFQAQKHDVQCDLMIVDGGHQYDVAMADLENFARMAAPGHILAIDDTPCTAGFCAGPTKAWQELVKQGCIAEDQSVSMGPDRGFSVGRYMPCPLWSKPAYASSEAAPVNLGVVAAGSAANPASSAAAPSIAKAKQANASVPKAHVEAARLPVDVAPVKLVAAKASALAPSPPPALNRTKEQKALDDDVKKNMNTSWKSVKDIKAKRTEGPKGFDKPLKTHEGSKGVIGILEILVQDSESLIEQDVKDEENDLGLYLKNVEKTKSLIASKDKEAVMLNQVKSDADLKLTQTEEQKKIVQTEIKDINDFLAIVEKQCKAFLSNFDANQAARAQEISDTIEAKEVLLGMAEDSSLVQVDETIQRLRRVRM